jgi:hypothetical protein
MSPARRFVTTSRSPGLAGALVGVFVGIAVLANAAWAQGIGPVTFRDSLVMRQIAYRAPCPDPVPIVWSRVDSTLGRPPRCSLVELAARAISQFLRVRPPQAGSADPWNPLCVRVIVGRNTGSTGLPGDWLVIFDLAADQPAYVVIDRQTGDVGLTLIGREQLVDRPRCLTG